MYIHIQKSYHFKKIFLKTIHECGGKEMTKTAKDEENKKLIFRLMKTLWEQKK